MLMGALGDVAACCAWAVGPTPRAKALPGLLISGWNLAAPLFENRKPLFHVPDSEAVV